MRQIINGQHIKWFLTITFVVIVGLFIIQKLRNPAPEVVSQDTEIIQPTLTVDKNLEENSSSNALLNSTNLSENVDEAVLEKKLKPYKIKVKIAEKEIKNLIVKKKELLSEYQEESYEVQSVLIRLELARETLQQSKKELFNELSKIYGKDKSRSF